MEWILGADNVILDWIQTNLRTGWLDFIMPGITALGDIGIVWILATVLLLCFKKTRRIGVAAAIALLFSLLVTNLIVKPIFDRIRPFEANGFTGLLVEPPTDPSFPSGHTSASFAAATAMVLYSRKIGIPALVLAVLIAFSRMYLYVHYPSDVAVGMLIGLLAGGAGWLLEMQIFRFMKEHDRKKVEK